MIKPNNLTKSIEMNQYDFGVVFTFTLDNMVEGSTFKFKIYKDETIVEKDIVPEENVLSLSLTEEESALLEIGEYFWSLEQYVENILHNTIVIDKNFVVVKGKEYGTN